MGWIGDGLGWVWDHTAGALLGAAGGLVWDQVIGGIVNWIVEAVAWFVSRVLSLLDDSTRVDLTQDWFLEPGSPYRRVLAIAAVVLVAMVFIGIIQGLLAGDPWAMVARIARDLPLAVIGMVLTIDVTQLLLRLTDEVSRGVLRQGGDDAREVMDVLTTGSAFSGQTSFVIVALGLFCILAALLVWIELVVRSGLIYLMIALSPLIFAAMVWPSARGMLRKFAELTLALIFSKVVIAIALSVAAAALAGVGDARHADAGFTGNVTASAGTLFSGAVIFLLAAFSPFLILRLFPVLEAAVIAQGVSRGPVRAANTAAASTFYLDRIAGSRGRSAPATAGAGGNGNGSGPAGRGPVVGGPGGGAPAGPPAAGRAPAGSSGGAASGGTGGAAAPAAAAAGPAAAAVAVPAAGVEAARATKERIARSARGHADAPRERREH